MTRDVFSASGYQPAGLAIEAWMEKPAGGYRIVRADLDRIAYRADNGDGTSAIIMADGKEITVALTLEALDAKIAGHSFRDGDLIDLKPVTEKQGFPEPEGTEFLRQFNIAAESGKTYVALHCYYRNSDKNLAEKVIFEANKISEYTQYENAQFVYLSSADVNSGFAVVMKPGELKIKIEEALRTKALVLDLFEETLPPRSMNKTLSPAAPLFLR